MALSARWVVRDQNGSPLVVGVAELPNRTAGSKATDRSMQFPYALEVLPDFLHHNWDEPSFKPYRDAFPEDARDTPEHLESYVRELTAQDLKVACLKQLQGKLFPLFFGPSVLLPIRTHAPSCEECVVLYKSSMSAELRRNAAPFVPDIHGLIGIVQIVLGVAYHMQCIFLHFVPVALHTYCSTGAVLPLFVASYTPS
jgi:hypothetical protein